MCRLSGEGDLEAVSQNHNREILLLVGCPGQGEGGFFKAAGSKCLIMYLSKSPQNLIVGICCRQKEDPGSSSSCKKRGGGDIEQAAGQVEILVDNLVTLTASLLPYFSMRSCQLLFSIRSDSLTKWKNIAFFFLSLSPGQSLRFAERTPPEQVCYTRQLLRNGGIYLIF